MMRIRLNSFAGMFPKVHPSRLQETASTQMQDMLLENGVLTPVTVPATTLDGIADNIAQAWCHDVSLLSQYPWRLFDSQVSISRSPNFDAEFKRYYWSNDGKGGGLVQTLLPGQSKPSKDYKVGVPAPTAKPSAVCNIGDVSDAGRIISVMNPVTGRIEYRNVGAGEFSTIQQYMPDGSTPDESRSYVITYVNEFNEESAPSPPSDIVVCPLTDSNMQLDYGNGVKKTVRVDVTIDQRDYLNAESQGYPRITKLRIYRTNVASNGIAEFQFVAERDVNQSDSEIVILNGVLFYDRVASSLLSEVLPTQNWLPPSSTLKAFGISNGAFGYGYNAANNRICFSLPATLYAWDPNYELTSRYPVVAINHYDNVIVIATEGELLLAIGDAPESLSVIAPANGRGCVSARSMVSTGISCIYASNDGLMMVSGQSVQNITENIFDRKGWQALNPKSIHAYYYQGNYVFFYDNGTTKAGYLIDLNNVAQGIMQLSNWCVSGYVDKQSNELYLLDDKPGGGRKLMKFNPDKGAKQTASWQSKLFNLDMPKRMLAGQVIADSYNDVVMTVTADNKKIGEYHPKNAKPFRIHNHSVRRDFQLSVKGSDVVREIALGESMRDMLD